MQKRTTATLYLSTASSLGTFTPNSFTIQPNEDSHWLTFTPAAGFLGGAVPIIVLGYDVHQSCASEQKVDFPELCRPSSCHLEYRLRAVVCRETETGALYQTVLSINNPFGNPVVLSLSTPSAAGSFSPNPIALGTNGNDIPLTFVPAPGFTGGMVHVFMTLDLGHGEICTTDFMLEFPPLCGNTSPRFNVEAHFNGTPFGIKNNLLLVAPNPASNTTTLFYSYGNYNAVKSIYLIDMLGRTLQSWLPNNAKGSIAFDCSIYAQGQYLLVMKDSNTVINSSKLIITNSK